MRFPFSKKDTRKARCINCGSVFQASADTDEVELCKKCNVSTVIASKLEELKSFLLSTSLSTGKFAVKIFVFVVLSQLLIAYLRETVLGQVFVEGFIREDGTKVSAHWRKK